MNRMEMLWNWNRAFFGQPALAAATPESQLIKLRQELDELEEDQSVEEAADIMVCLIGFCIKKGYTHDQFFDALRDKTQVNLDREWDLQPDGTYQHVKEKS